MEFSRDEKTTTTGVKNMKYPKVIKVKVISNLELEVSFDNGEVRLYNVTKLLTKATFEELANVHLFKQVKVDPHGYGIYWNDNLDLAESELFENSILLESQDSQMRSLNNRK